MRRLRSDDADHFFDNGIYAPTRTLFVGTEVNEKMVERFLKGMALLAVSTDPISIIMNNTGGDWYHGLALYDAILTSKAYVTITVYGHAFSMGSIIFQSADERIISPNTVMMLHYGDDAFDGATREATSWHTEVKRTKQKLEQIYLKRIKQAKPRFTITALRKLLEVDCYFTAEETVKMGLADKILIQEN